MRSTSESSMKIYLGIDRPGSLFRVSVSIKVR